MAYDTIDQQPQRLSLGQVNYPGKFQSGAVAQVGSITGSTSQDYNPLGEGMMGGQNSGVERK
jgi:hypothetical protein